jgi:hypothetical protein
MSKTLYHGWNSSVAVLDCQVLLQYGKLHSIILTRLRDISETLPVQWASFVSEVGVYQGTIV